MGLIVVVYAQKSITVPTTVPVNKLPASVAPFIKSHFNNTIREAGIITDAKGRQTYEAEIKGRDLIFDIKGKYLGKDD